MRAKRITVQTIRQHIQCEADAYIYLEDLRWHGSPVCAHCGSDRVKLLNPENGISRKTRTGSASQRRVWKCYTCRKQFSVITGTIFHGTKVSLEIWVFILFEMCANKNGIAAREIERKYGLTPKTAWFMTQRIREAMKREPLAGLLANTTIEADATWIGGKPKNKHQQGRPSRLPGGGKGRAGTPKHMVPVLSLIDRQTGDVYSQVINDVNGETVGAALAERVDAASTHLVSDGGMEFRPNAKNFASHQWVDHSSHEYVRGAVTTNSAEGYFSQLKRSIDGTHHHVSRKHLGRYLAEFDFRYSTRKVNDTVRLNDLMGQVGGKRLTYRPVIGQ